MKHKFLAFVVLAVAVAVVAVPVFGHHGGAVYDNEKWTTLTGTITKFEYVNPHILIYIAHKAPNGEIQNWVLEVSPPSLQSKRGWRKDMAKAGDTVVYDVRASKNGAFVGRGSDKMLVNGKMVGNVGGAG